MSSSRSPNYGQRGTMRGVSGIFYGMTVIGSAVYFVGQASGFWTVILGLLKACVWPVFVTLKALDLLHL